MTPRNTTGRRLRSWLVDLIRLFGRRIHLVRAGSLYSLAAHYLRTRCICGIIDGGAFDGQHALDLARIFPSSTVYAFEPTPESYSLLSRNVTGVRRIVPESLALAEKTGTKMLNINRLSSTNSFLPTATSREAQVFFAGRGDTIRQVAVQTIALDEYAQEKGIQVDLLKLDLQGAELSALRGARAVLESHCQAVVSEVRFKPTYVGDVNFFEIDSYLAGCGFCLMSLAEITHHPVDKTLFEANALWLRTF